MSFRVNVNVGVIIERADWGMTQAPTMLTLEKGRVSLECVLFLGTYVRDTVSPFWDIGS